MEQIISLIGLLVTVLGWGATAYYQRQLLEKTITADKEKPIQQRRLELLPGTLDKLQETHGWLMHLTRRLVSYPGLNSMDEPLLREFAQSVNFSNYETEQLLKAPDKIKYYRKTKFWHDLAKAQNSLANFHNYVLQNKFIMTSDLSNQLASVDELFHSTLVAIQVGGEVEDIAMICRAGDDLNGKAPGLIAEIEKAVQEALGCGSPPK
jgi:hypothetical protein